MSTIGGGTDDATVEYTVKVVTEDVNVVSAHNIISLTDTRSLSRTHGSKLSRQAIMLHGLVSPTKMRPSIALLLLRQVRATWPNLAKMFVQPNQNNRVNISPNLSWLLRLLFQILMPRQMSCMCAFSAGEQLYNDCLSSPIEYKSLGSFQICIVLTSTAYNNYFFSLGIGRIDSNQIRYVSVPLSTRAISGIRCLSLSQMAVSDERT